MSLRVNRDNLDQMTPWARKQIEEHLDPPDNLERLPIRAPAPRKTVNRPEEDAGRTLVQYMDLLTLPGGLKPGLFFRSSIPPTHSAASQAAQRQTGTGVPQ